MRGTKQVNRGTRRRSDFSDFVDRLIARNEKRPNQAIQINRLAFENGIEKRRLYDLMNVLVACNICTKIDTHNYRWLSLGNARIAVQRVSLELESRALDTPIIDLFVLPSSPSIGLMTTMFIGAFLFFNLASMNIRDASILMASDAAHYKPILRRLYLVAFLLERVGLFRHKQKMGDYEILADVELTCKNSLTELSREGRFPPSSIEYRLNRFDDNYMRVVSDARQKQLRDIAAAKMPDNETLTPVAADELIVNAM